ncbi:hypothetical protein TNIN_468351 [Trichonephila inaurata madagascariensis]|uniref:DUF4817 domain-containing protein n=1 Tax=Trichonephila inaurata madagascariensis TaxID=2747483 RepID=A0A8X6YIY7_9ARAC|nr:hypothetical protein TNIN_468351 [Trichonephila inaurata madagascariensis]
MEKGIGNSILVIIEFMLIYYGPYSTKQRVKIIEFLNSCQRSIVMTERKFRQYFNSISAPTAFMIRSLVGRFEELGSVAKPSWKRCPSKYSHMNNVETVRQISSRMRLELWKRFPGHLTEQ